MQSQLSKTNSILAYWCSIRKLQPHTTQHKKPDACTDQGGISEASERSLTQFDEVIIHKLNGSGGISALSFIGPYSWLYSSIKRLEHIGVTSRCFISTATTTLTSTNCAINTKTTKNKGAMTVLTQQFVTHDSEGSQSSRSASWKEEEQVRGIICHITSWKRLAGPAI